VRFTTADGRFDDEFLARVMPGPSGWFQLIEFGWPVGLRVEVVADLPGDREPGPDGGASGGDEPDAYVEVSPDSVALAQLEDFRGAHGMGGGACRHVDDFWFHPAGGALGSLCTPEYGLGVWPDPCGGFVEGVSTTFIDSGVVRPALPSSPWFELELVSRDDAVCATRWAALTRADLRLRIAEQERFATTSVQLSDTRIGFGTEAMNSRSLCFDFDDAPAVTALADATLEAWRGDESAQELESFVAQGLSSVTACVDGFVTNDAEHTGAAEILVTLRNADGESLQRGIATALD
jgi:hypothetical protein